MNPRSALVGTAALLLASVAIPATTVLAPVPAYAQELSALAQEALADKTEPSSLDRKVLRERIKALREAVQSGALKGPQRKEAQQKIKAYREVIQAGNKQPDEQAAAEDADAAGATKQSQAKPAQKSAQSEESAGAVADTGNLSDLKMPDLRKRAKELRTAIQSGKLKGVDRKAAAQKLKALRAEIKKRRDGEGGQKQAADDDGMDDDAPAQAGAKPAELLADKKPAADLDEQALRTRVSDTRAALAAKDLPAAEQRDLRKRLADDRKVLRERVAVRNEQSASVANETAQGNEVNTSIDNQGGVVNNNTTINNSVTNVNTIVQEQTPPDKLSERQLNQRIRTLRSELDARRVDSGKVEVANRILVEDRRALHDRMLRDRDRRRADLRRMRDRNELRIDFNVVIAPPPIIAAAEVDYAAIQTQLVAPPRRMPPRRYTYEQVIEDDAVRETMPGIDIDTVNFDFGSAEIRPEEVDKLDSVGEAIEKIVAVRPDEVFIVEGHTDAVGTDQANVDLSRARAESVKAALTEYFLIEPGNIRTVGLGERYLKIPTEEPEEENRRVTIRRITPLLTGEAG